MTLHNLEEMTVESLSADIIMHALELQELIDKGEKLLPHVKPEWYIKDRKRSALNSARILLHGLCNKFLISKEARDSQLEAHAQKIDEATEVAKYYFGIR